LKIRYDLENYFQFWKLGVILKTRLSWVIFEKGRKIEESEEEEIRPDFFRKEERKKKKSCQKWPKKLSKSR
jgi:hypothetical protein